MEQYQLWQKSHHDLAMQPANALTMLGDFDDASFDYYGTVSKFYKKGNEFIVQTDGPDGKLTDYPVAYAFGVYPLQQYLIKFPKGHYQALNIAWDTRSKKEGGQRWYHLYPDEHIKYDDELHWTGINHNWNYMCADCHSTNLQKNYDITQKEYSTTWSSIDVSCEACHGPASSHIDWAENDGAENNSAGIKNKGFSVAFNERISVSWTIDSVTGNAKRNHPKKKNVEVEACAQCHARRSTSFPDARPEHALLDNFWPALLTDPLYHADGQINGEVYVYGSFIQSKMYHAGVTCSDCHQPHSLKIRADGNDLCAQCHLPTKYDSTDHHLHKANTEGAQCINCHMPSKNYMVVDRRRDHSFRIPRPDLSVKLDAPNACTQCHTDKPAQWAAAKLEKKYGKPSKGHYGEALYAGRHGLPGAEKLLSELIADDTQPAIARATAVTLIPPFLSRQSAPLLQLAANEEQPLLGLGLAIALDAIPEQHRLPFAYPLLYDDKRITRLQAARTLLGTSLQSLPAETKTVFNQALEEYKAVQLFNADRPESLVNLAGLYAQQGQIKKAEQFYKDAISLAPYYTPAYVNLADLYRESSNEVAGEAVLRKALLQIRDKAAIQHALGLLLVRQKKLPEAIEYLRLAAESSTPTDRYVYVYAIALNSSGKSKQALNILELAQHQYPGNTDIIYALLSINKDLGNQKKAQHYENILRKPVR
jgi:tetratricopeptide (TPR) repeat protein